MITPNTDASMAAVQRHIMAHANCADCLADWQCPNIQQAIDADCRAAQIAVLLEANARAEAEMLKTHVLEGAHGRAIGALLAELEGAKP